MQRHLWRQQKSAEHRGLAPCALLFLFIGSLTPFCQHAHNFDLANLRQRFTGRGGLMPGQMLHSPDPGVHPDLPERKHRWLPATGPILCREPSLAPESPCRRVGCHQLERAAPDSSLSPSVRGTQRHWVRRSQVLLTCRSDEMMPGCLQHLTGMGQMELFDQQVVGIECGNGKDGDACGRQGGDQ